MKVIYRKKVLDRIHEVFMDSLIEQREIERIELHPSDFARLKSEIQPWFCSYHLRDEITLFGITVTEHKEL